MFSSTVLVIGCPSWPVNVTRISTLFPGKTKPDTPTTLSTFTAMARLFGVTTAAMPPALIEVGARLDSKMGSFAFTG